MCLQALKVSQNILEQTKTNKNEPITSTFKHDINNYLQKNPPDFKIECEMAKKAMDKE